MDPGQQKKYHLTLLIPKKPDDPKQRELLKKMYQSCSDLCKQEFGCELGGKSKGKTVRSPFRCGSEKEHLSGYDGTVWVVRFSGKMRPQVVDGRKRPIDEDSGAFYNGCYAHVSYNVYKYDKNGNVGIGLGLYNVQKVGDGDSFGSSSSDPDDDFEEIEDLASAGVGDQDEDDEFFK